MEEIVLSAEKREKLTSGQLNVSRKEGKIPAVVYGAEEETIPLFVSRKSFEKIKRQTAGKNPLIRLEIGGLTPKTVLLKKTQYHPVNSSILHLDFQQVSLKKKVEVSIPLEIVGEAKGVKAGGILEHPLWEIKIRCLPTKIPSSLPVDISNLDIGESISLKELSLPEDIELLSNPEQIVVSVVVAPKVEEVSAAVPAAPGAVTEPEVIGKGKKEKEEEEVEEKEKSK